jgi:hypothetical protein
MSRPLPGQTALDLLDTGDFAPGPDRMYRWNNVGKGGKALASGMQKDQIVVALLGERLFGANPEGTLHQARELSRSLRFDEIAILPFVIFHARLGDERLAVSKRPDHIGQVVMRLAKKGVADGEGAVLGAGSR